MTGSRAYDFALLDQDALRHGCGLGFIGEDSGFISGGGVIDVFCSFVHEFSDWPKLIIGLIVFAATFLLSLIATRALKKPDIENLRLMASGLGPLKGIVDKLLNILETMVSSSAS